MRRDSFYNFNEKKSNSMLKTVKARTLQALILEQRLLTLAQFCRPFGSILIALGTLFDPF